MGKLLNHRVYIVIIVLCICVGVAFLVRSLLSEREIDALVMPANVEQGMPIAFADSTLGAKRWMWEFGNGDHSSRRSGDYIYPETGKYQIRLTVDGELEKNFIVNVRAPRKEDDLSQLIRIIAPDKGVQGEYITFRGEGSSKEWRWEFGETGSVDAREKTAIYQYAEPGFYEILLSTEETKYPVRHNIEIIPQYIENDTTDIFSVIGNDIKEHLQAIADQESFNVHYNYILNTYLCNEPYVIVVVNNTKKNDFYSYCQGLKIVGRNRTRIERVLIDSGDMIESCIKKIVVIQTDYK